MKRFSVGGFQQQPTLEGVANEQKDSSRDVSSHRKEVTPSSFVENDVRQRLIERLRSGSRYFVENRPDSDSPQTVAANVVERSQEWQLLSDHRMSNKKRGVTQGELSTSGSNIEVLAHRQRLINQLRGGGSDANN